jgi:hypothetical protein
LAAADFNADGAMDVVAGYATDSGGVLAVLRGNPDAYAPKNPSLYKKALQGSMPSTFLSKATVFAVPESPDLLVTGDFNRDGHKDVLVAARGGALYLLAGDGRGNLLPPKEVALPGQVMALAVTADGHVAVSMEGAHGAQLALLAPSSQGLIRGATYTLPARGDAVAWGNLGGGADLAVGAGAHVVMIYNALAANAQTETVSVPFQVLALTLGDFIWDRDGRTEIAVLANDGSIHILQHGTLDTKPLTAADVPGRRAAMMARNKQPPNPTALGEWSVAKQLPYSGSTPAGPVSPSAFNSPRLAAAPAQDLMLLDAERRELNILDTSGKAASPSATVSFSAAPLAALTLPQKINAGRDIVVLAARQAAPVVISAAASSADPSVTVNTTADEDPQNACNDSSVTVSDLTGMIALRAAVCAVNNSGAGTYTISLPPGTYDLVAFDTAELQVGLTQNQNVSIVGTGTPSNTTIQQTDGNDRIFEQDPAFIGDISLSISNVTLVGGSCSSTGIDCVYGGGALLGGGPSGSPDNITLTNVIVSHNTAGSFDLGENGGAMDISAAGTYTFTNCTFSNNTAVYHGAPQDGGGAGGAIYVDNNTSSGNVTITNCTFTGNTAQNGGGGALYSAMSTGDTATITGSTFTGNHALDDAADDGAFGGAIVGLGDMTLSNSRVVGNTSADGAAYGTGLWASNNGAPISVVAIDNWWGCNAGPGATGCDTAAVPIGNPDGASLTYNPWLVLGISASATQILPNGTSNLTADLTHDSGGNGGFSVPDGTSVAFGGTLGTDNPTGATTTSGQATSTFTAGNATGAGSATATVDNQVVSVTINIQATSSTSTTVYDAGTGSPWAGSEVAGASSYDTATVSGTGGSAPSGTVSYTEYGNGSCSGSSIGGSTVTLSNGSVPNSTTFGPLAAGRYSFQAAYSGDSNYLSSTGSCESFSVGQGTTTTALASSANPAQAGQLVTFTATVSGYNPTGTVGFTSNGTTICSMVPLTSGVAQCATSTLPLNTDAIVATYSGDSNNIGSTSSTLSQAIQMSTFTVSPSPVPFGNEQTNVASASMPVTVTNTGNVLLPITSIALSGTNSGQFSQTNACTSIAVRSSCKINVVFTPTSPGSKTANLNVNAGRNAGTQTAMLTGTGVVPVPTYMVSPNPLQFDDEPLNVPNSMNVTVTNTGTVPLPITSITLTGTNSGQFSQTSCTSPVAIKGTCTITVMFTPTSTGSKTANLNVNTGGGAKSTTVVITGTGT